MIDEAVQFGENNSLVGIISRWPDDTRRIKKPAVIILNAGFLHRVGPGRMHVTLARALAEQGFSVLRFDFSGIGDSRIRQDALPYLEASMEEMRLAMDLLHERFGSNEFVVVGLCSGADNGFRIACSDNRIVGGVFIESFIRFSLRYHVEKACRLVSWLKWLKQFKKSLQSAIHLFQDYRLSNASGPSEGGHPHLPEAKEITESMKAIFHRGGRYIFVYSQQWPGNSFGRHLLPKIIKKYKISSVFQTMLFESAEHSFMTLHEQKQLIDVVAQWMHHYYG